VPTSAQVSDFSDGRLLFADERIHWQQSIIPGNAWQKKYRLKTNSYKIYGKKKATPKRG